MGNQRTDKQFMELVLDQTAQLVKNHTPEEIEQFVRGDLVLEVVPVERPAGGNAAAGNGR